MYYLLLDYFPGKIKAESTHLVTSITDGVVTNVAAWSKQGLSNQIKLCTFNCRGESMHWVVTVIVPNMARNAEVIVLARHAGNEVLLGEF